MPWSRISAASRWAIIAPASGEIAAGPAAARPAQPRHAAADPRLSRFSPSSPTSPTTISCAARPRRWVRASVQRLELSAGLSARRVRAFLARCAVRAGDHRPSHRGAAQIHSRPRNRDRRLAGTARTRQRPDRRAERKSTPSSSAPSASCGRPACCATPASRSATRSTTISRSSSRTFLTQVPAVKRRLARLFQLDGEILPYLRPGSWVGGDRDGNPNVSPETLDYAVRHQAELALDHYLHEIHALGAELSLSDSLVATSAALKKLAASAGPISRCIRATSLIAGRWSPVMPAWRRRGRRCWGAGRRGRRAIQAEPYAAPEEFAADLDIIAASLRGQWRRRSGRRPAAESARGGGGVRLSSRHHGCAPEFRCP